MHVKMEVRKYSLHNFSGRGKGERGEINGC